jgi:hypothetical protein
MTNFGEYFAPADVKRWQLPALGIGFVGTLIVLGAALFFPEYREQALRSWLLGFIFWAGIGLGSLGVLILQYLTGGAWGVVTRRTLEAGSRTLPIIVLLFLPLVFGINSLYEWTHIPNDPVVVHRGWYMTAWGWIARSAIYFAIFWVMQRYLNNWSAKQDQTSNPEDSAKYLGKATAFSGPTLVVYALTVTFAAVDWMMTLDPHWFSTIWGLLFVAGWALSCFCFVVTILAFLSDKAPLNRVLGKRHFHDLGKLMLALVMVWAYFNFSQFLIIWAGNIPEETSWFIDRMRGVWGWIGVILILFHFAFPFLVLLQQDFKRRAKWLASIAIFILVLRIIDMFYMIGPSPRIHAGAAHGEFGISWLDFVAPIAVGGLWLWWFFRELTKLPLVPMKDPFFEKAIEHGHGH